MEVVGNMKAAMFEMLSDFQIMACNKDLAIGFPEKTKV
jgi:hypothetical protein